MARLVPPARSVRLAALIAFVAVVALPQTCFACSCVQPTPTPTAALANAAVVFRGTVTSVEPARSGRATFRVSTAWKGQVTSEMVVYGGTPDNSCSFEFQPGTEYVIYADQGVSGGGWNVPAHSFVASVCNRTAPVSQAADDLAALGPGQPPIPGLPPSTGDGYAATTASRAITGTLLIAGSLAVFAALAWRGRGGSATGNAARHQG
jgi:hypothetical protein